jgi:hypothetical protein
MKDYVNENSMGFMLSHIILLNIAIQTAYTEQRWHIGNPVDLYAGRAWYQFWP